MTSWRNLLPGLVAAFWLSGAVGARAGGPESFADTVDKVMPSVVNISVKGMGTMPARDKDAKNVSYAPQIVEIVGSGAIVDSSGRRLSAAGHQVRQQRQLACRRSS